MLHSPSPYSKPLSPCSRKGAEHALASHGPSVYLLSVIWELKALRGWADPGQSVGGVSDLCLRFPSPITPVLSEDNRMGRVCIELGMAGTR